MMKMREIRKKKSFWQNITYGSWAGALLCIFAIPGALEYMDQTHKFNPVLILAVILSGIFMWIAKKAAVRLEEWETEYRKGNRRAKDKIYMWKHRA